MSTDPFNYDVYGDIGELQTSFDVFKYLRGATETFGMRYFFVVNLPTDKSGSFATQSVVNNWPPELIKCYDQADMINISPVTATLRSTSAPVIWHIEDVFTDNLSEKLEHVRNSFYRCGFVRGASFPVTDARGVRGAIGFSGDRSALEKSEVLELSMISLQVFNRLSAIACQIETESPPLSERELECLRWTAVGKTSSEIATILDLSEHTVNHHLNGATKKLDAANRTQAVANAIRSGWI